MNADMGTRRGNREGSYRQKWRTTSDGRTVPAGWEGRVLLTGIGRHVVYGKTEAIAKAKIRKLVEDAERGFRPLDEKMTVAQWLETWLETYVRPNRAPRTYESYRDTCEDHLIPYLGHRRLTKLEPEHIAALLAAKAKPDEAGVTLSGTTVRYIYAVLRIALGRALKAGKVHRNVATLVDPPRKSVREVRPLDDAQMRTLISALANDPDEALIAVLLTAGLRKAELLGLTWPHVDRETGRLTVHDQLSRDGQLVEPKRGSRRTVTLPPTALAALRLHWARQRQAELAAHHWDTRGLVFAGPEGQPLDHGYPNKALNRVIAKAGVSHQRVHDLRHGFASLLLSEGVELAVVSKLLGHADLSTTSDVYSHLSDGMRREASERIEAALRRTS